MGSCEKYEELEKSPQNPSIQTYLNYPSMIINYSIHLYPNLFSSASPTVWPSRNEVCAMRWGLVPSFAKNEEEYNAFKGGNSTFNARIEGPTDATDWPGSVSFVAA